MKVDHSTTSALEHANLLVKLDKNTRLLSHFKIMPKFKVHTEGVEIREHDHILLESVKISGQCATGRFADVSIPARGIIREARACTFLTLT
jgi:hypothetical protein